MPDGDGPYRLVLDTVEKLVKRHDGFLIGELPEAPGVSYLIQEIAQVDTEWLLHAVETAPLQRDCLAECRRQRRQKLLSLGLPHVSTFGVLIIGRGAKLRQQGAPARLRLASGVL